jgi:hypothetical protein
VINTSNDISRDKTYNMKFAEGKYMANIDWYSDFGVFGLCYIPELDFIYPVSVYFSSQEVGQEEFRYSVNISGLDAGLAVSYDTNSLWREGVNFSATVGDSVEIHGEGALIENKTRLLLQTNQVITGFDQLRMKPVYSGFLTNVDETINNIAELIIGGSYNSDLFSIMIEYYYNQSGYDFEQWNGIRSAFKGFRDDYDESPGSASSIAGIGEGMSFMENSDYLGICRHYAFIRFSSPANEKLSLSWITLLNLQDLSGMAIFTAGYTWEHLTLTGEFTFNFGDDYSEFRLLGQSWTASLEAEIGI